MKKSICVALLTLSASLWAAPELGKLSGIAFTGATHWRTFELISGTPKNCVLSPAFGSDLQTCEVENASFKFTSDGPVFANPFAGKVKLVYLRDSQGRYESFRLTSQASFALGAQTITQTFRVNVIVELSTPSDVLQGTILIGDDRSGFSAKREP